MNYIDKKLDAARKAWEAEQNSIADNSTLQFSETDSMRYEALANGWARVSDAVVMTKYEAKPFTEKTLLF